MLHPRDQILREACMDKQVRLVVADSDRSKVKKNGLQRGGGDSGMTGFEGELGACSVYMM